jgi:DNA-directed RNA polymerase subunit beta
MITIKSDDVVGRVKVYESLVKGLPIPKSGVPESFRVLLKEFQALGLDITVLNDEGNFVDIKELEKEDDDTYLSTDEFESSEEVVPDSEEEPIEEDIDEEEDIDFDDLEPGLEDLENVFMEGDE